jgi:hypothetical protein
MSVNTVNDSLSFSKDEIRKLHGSNQDEEIPDITEASYDPLALNIHSTYTKRFCNDKVRIEKLKSDVQNDPLMLTNNDHLLNQSKLKKKMPFVIDDPSKVKEILGQNKRRYNNDQKNDDLQKLKFKTDPQAYLQTVKSNLSKKEYKEFQLLLRRYKSDELNVIALLERMVIVFLPVGYDVVRKSLFVDFRVFIGGRNYKIFDEFVSNYVDP